MAENKYLDKAGLETLVAKIKSEDEKRVPKSTATTAHSPALVKVGTNANGLVENDDLVEITYQGDIEKLDDFRTQTVKGNGTAFGAGDAVDIVAGGNISVTSDTTNKKITIAYTGAAGNDNQKVKSGSVTFGDNDVVNIKAATLTDNPIIVTGNATSKEITIQHGTVPSGEVKTAAAYKVGKDSFGHVVIGDALATVASSGNYNDLSNRPTIGSGVLTIQANGTQKGTFSANATSNATINITASDLGLSAALVFVGVSTTDPKGASGATVEGHTTWKKGEVVLYGSKEFVLKADGNVAANWVELGDEGSHALKTITITGTGALSGGGSLEANRTITHNTGNQTAFSAGAYKIGADSYGHVIQGDPLNSTTTQHDGHTHGLSATVTVPSVSKTANSYNVSTTASASFVKSYPGVFSKLVVGSFTPAVSAGNIIPAVDNGTVKPAVNLTTNKPTRTVYSGVTASKCNAANTVKVGDAVPDSNPTSFVNSVGKTTTTAYTASYDSTNDCLELTPFTFDAVGTVGTGSVRGCSGSTVTLNSYFGDVSASNITSNNDITCAVEGNEVSVAKVGTAVPYAKMATVTVAYATGQAAADGTGQQFMTALGDASTGTAVGSVSFAKVTSGGVSLVDSVTIGSTTATVSGTATSGGAHTHDINY